MKPTRYKGFIAEDYKGAPSWFLNFLQPLSEALGDLVAILSGRITRADNMLSKAEPIAFKTQTTAINTFPLRFKNKLGVKVTAASVDMFSRKDGGALTGPWSATIRPNQNDELEVTFQGLENSTEYIGVLIYEG